MGQTIVFFRLLGGLPGERLTDRENLAVGARSRVGAATVKERLPKPSSAPVYRNYPVPLSDLMMLEYLLAG